MNVWSRVLTNNEIYNLAETCDHAKGDIASWADFREDLGGAYDITPKSYVCECKSCCYNDTHCRWHGSDVVDDDDDTMMMITMIIMIIIINDIITKMVMLMQCWKIVCYSFIIHSFIIVLPLLLLLLLLMMMFMFMITKIMIIITTMLMIRWWLRWWLHCTEYPSLHYIISFQYQ